MLSITQWAYLMYAAHATLEIENALTNCPYNQLFPNYAGPAVGHVRTHNTATIGAQLHRLAKHGLNFRLRLRIMQTELVAEAIQWAPGMIGHCLSRVQHSGDVILQHFQKAVRTHKQTSSCDTNQKLPTAQQLNKPASNAILYLVATSTDTAANTCTFECKRWYVAVCLRRLLSNTGRTGTHSATPTSHVARWLQRYDLVKLGCHVLCPAIWQGECVLQPSDLLGLHSSSYCPLEPSL